jgi:hypothetical protein
VLHCRIDFEVSEKRLKRRNEMIRIEGIPVVAASLAERLMARRSDAEVAAMARALHRYARSMEKARLAAARAGGSDEIHA